MRRPDATPRAPGGAARTAPAALLALAALAPPAGAEPALPFYLRFAANQCPPWTEEDRPRQAFLDDAVSAIDPPYRLRGDPPIRLDEVGTWVVNGVRHAIPVGHMPGQLTDDVYEAAVRGDGHETTGFYGLAFWMPSGRMVERQFGSYQRFCEPGRPPPEPGEYAVGATVLPPGSAQAAEWRAERLLWRERTETALGAPIADVLAGRVPEHANRLVPDIPGAIVYDGLSWSDPTSERAPNPDPLRITTYRLSKGDLFGTLYCPAVFVVARTDRTRAEYTPCDVRVGPADPAGRLPEADYTIPYRDAHQWADVYAMTLEKTERWRAAASGDCAHLLDVATEVDRWFGTPSDVITIPPALRDRVAGLDGNACDPRTLTAAFAAHDHFCEVSRNGAQDVFSWRGEHLAFSFGWSDAGAGIDLPAAWTTKDEETCRRPAAR